MGAVWLGSLPAVCRSTGYPVIEWAGWRTRSRSSGGYDSLLGIGVHHDAIQAGTSLANRCTAAWDSSWNPNRPVGALWLHNDGTIVVGAAGATNTQGRGPGRTYSRGYCPENSGNRHILSIEASNNGVGEVWPQVQQDAYVALCAALCDAYGLSEAQDVVAHFETAPGRKIDPAGPSRYAAGRQSWNMNAFRNDVIAHGAQPPPTGPLPGGSDMIQPVAKYRNSDTRAYGGMLQPGKDYDFGLNPSVVPSNAVAASLVVAAVPGGTPGWLDIRPAGTPFGNTSTINFEGTGAHNGATTVGVKDLKFTVRCSQPTHVIVDVTAFWTP